MGQASRKKREAREQKQRGGGGGAGRTSPPAASSGAGAAVPASPAVFGGGAVLLLVAVAASVMLVLQKLADAALPGCGPESACAKAQSSVWGSIPGLGWSTANVGVAWFLGLLAAWIATRGRLPGALRALVAAGAIGSLVLTVVMLVEGYLCPYCLAAHVANVAFTALVFAAGGAAAAAASIGRAAMPATAAFVIATGGLAVAESQHQARIDEDLTNQMNEGVTEVIERGAENAAAGDGASTADADEPFTGRYRRGPERAAIRLVVFTDFQCPDCKRVEGEIAEVLAERDDVNLHVKHFPMDGNCNEMVRERMGRGPHPNACWAARAAEAAGILGGDEAFYRMHDWLFEESGSFTDRTLPPALREMGYDPQAFIAVMMGDETERRVQRDIEEALDLGLHFTPMVFVNGVEVKGWTRVGAVREAIEAIGAAGLEPMTAAEAGDQPPKALEKYLEDWQDAPRRPLPQDAVDWTLEPRGDAEAEVDVVVWADFESPSYRTFAQSMLRVVRDEPSIRVSVRHYPFSSECNPLFETNRFESSCLAARAVEAAGQLGGVDAWWEMHDALVAMAVPYQEGPIMAKATRMGLDPDAFRTTMNGAEVGSAIAEDARMGRRSGLRSVPWVFVNGRRVPRVNFDGEDFPALLLRTALEEAREDA